MTDKIAHITTVHSRLDTRIFFKECCSLAVSGYDVFLVVADGKGDERCKGVQILDVDVFSSRLLRMLIAPWCAFVVVMRCQPVVVHLHDPELLFIGLLLKLTGKRVIYDAHEDLPSQIKRKHWISSYLRKPIGVLTKYVLSSALYFYDAVVTATDAIEEKISHPNVVSIKNYPILSEFENIDLSSKVTGQFCYAGGISEERGLYTMLDSLPQDSVTLILAGNFFPNSLQNEVTQHSKWAQAEYTGFLSREEIARLYASSVGGLVLLQNDKGFEDSLPIKLFEYMSASLPIICSDFSLWQEIVDEHSCGIAVNPSDTEAISNAMSKIIADPLLAKKMGEEGRKAVAEKYNWSVEAKKLISLYEKLL